MSEVKQNALDDAQTNTKVKVQAVLCWSEYYNGKWRPTKTSDVSLPTAVDVNSPSYFNRASLRLGMLLEGQVLRLYINEEVSFSTVATVDADDPQTPLLYSVKRWPGSFLLYNTHSLPIRGDEDIKLGGDIGSASPFLQPEFVGDYNDRLALKYAGPNDQSTETTVLKTDMPFQLVSPRHELEDPWSAPFFFEDRRHVFYVTTETESVSVPTWDGYALIPAPAWDYKSPRLVLEEDPDLRLKPRPEPFTGRFMDGTGPVRRMVTEDAYINKAIATMDTVLYGDVEIGMQGGFLDEIQN